MVHRQQRSEIAGHVADGLLGEHVLDGIDRAVGNELESQQAPVAGVAVFIREEDGGVEGGQLIDLEIVGVLREIVGQDGLEESEQSVYVELGEDQGSCYGSGAAGGAFGIDITTGSDG